MASAITGPASSLPAGRFEIGALRAFVAVARQGTVGRAAEMLGRTQPSVSARLAQLEESWETRLFRRVARGMRLTPEGARLLPLAEAALRSLEELDRAAGLPAITGGPLRLGAGDALGRRMLPRALGRLTRRHPKIEVYLREGPGPVLLDALREGEIDLALVVSSAANAAEGVDLEPIVESEIVLMTPPGWSGARGRTVKLTALQDERLIALQPGSGFRAHLERAFSLAGVAFRPVIDVGNLSLVRRFVASGLGVAPVPAVAFSPRTDRAGLGTRRLDGVAPITYHRALRKGAPLPELTREFLALLKPA